MRRLACLLAIAFLFTACNIGSEITVKDDGTGTFGMTLFMAKSDIAMLSSLPGSKSVDPIKQMKQSLESNSALHMTVTEYQQDGGKGIRGTVPFTSINQLRTEMQAMSSTQGGSPLGGQGTFKDFTLAKTATGWHFESHQEAPTVPGVNASQNTSLGGSAGQLGEFFKKAISLQFKVTLPGKSSVTNATTVAPIGSSTTFTWIPDLNKPTAMSLVADTKLGLGGSFPVLPVAGGGIALIAIGSTLIAAKKRKAAAASGLVVSQATATEPVVPPDSPGIQEPPEPPVI